MTYHYTSADILFVQNLYKHSFSQIEINQLYHNRRQAEGTQTQKGDYTNFISKLSKGSKHTAKTIATAIKYEGKYRVVRHISYCLHITIKQATKVYNTRVLPLCGTRFNLPHPNNFRSIAHDYEACNSSIYYAFESIGYSDDFPGGDDIGPTLYTLLGSPDYTYIDIINGNLTKDMIMEEIAGCSSNGGIYEAVLHNVLILKH